MRYFIGNILESLSYLVFSCALLIRARADGRGVIKVLIWFYFFCFLIIVKATQSYGTSNSNIYLYAILCVISSFSLGAYFYNILESDVAKFIIVIFCVINATYYLVTIVIQDGYAVFDSLAFVLLSVNVVVLSFIYIVQLLRNVKEDSLSLNFDFWFVAAQFIYYVGAFAIFLTFGYLTNRAIDNNLLPRYTATLTWLWGIHNVLLFLSALFTLGGTLWIYYRRRLE